MKHCVGIYLSLHRYLRHWVAVYASLSVIPSRMIGANLLACSFPACGGEHVTQAGCLRRLSL